MPPPVELHLVRDWDAAWRALVRPWLAGPAALRRDYVLVPTRGQAHALKLRCVREGVPLLGVEFLTPGLARQKWRALTGSARPAIGRELLLLGLRALIEGKLAPLTPEDAAWGLWKSLQSDPERALEDFDQLLQAGFTAADFPLAPLREIFGELTRRVAALGYDFASHQSLAAALQTPAADAPKLGGRLLLYGFTAEHWPEFFPLAAFARCGTALTVVLPEPELRGRRGLDENWIELWSALLGVEPRVLDAGEPARTGAAVAALWTGTGANETAATQILVGHTREDEMRLVAAELERLLMTGAENIAVVFPRADAAHLRLAALLAERGLPFNDLLETAGALSVDAQLQRALLAFYERGARLEELLALWPLLRALNFTTQPLGLARDVCERVFDETQTHALAANRPRLAANERAEWREVLRITDRLLPAWPERLTLADALGRFAQVCAQFNLPEPEARPTLAAYAARDVRVLPARVIFSTLALFLPEKSPASDAPGRGLFAPITLTTRRRAAALAWSHLIFVEGNAGVWPARAESSCWLTDEQRMALNKRGRFTLGLFTSEDRSALEKTGYADLARNTREQVIFTAALFDEEEPELKLAPNAWVERVLLAQRSPGGTDWQLEKEFARRAVGVAVPADARTAADWFDIWRRRRDPAVPFDGYFLSADPAVVRPTRLAARLIERSVQDPAELWFEAVLGVRRVEWGALVRARKKSLGSLAHRLLAVALQGRPIEGVFMERPAPEAARDRLDVALTALRAHWPRDRYWDSFHAELGDMAATLLAKVYRLGAGGVVAVEAKLPEGTAIPLGADCERLEIIGRMDLALLDRPEWGGAQVDIVDFKTGADAKLSAERMARGASLQLGVYLAAVESLGAAGGRVWMLKPGNERPVSMEMRELSVALAPLAQLARHLATGRYGALTPDRTDFSRGYEWPLACTPIRHAVLEKKFAATFGAPAAEAEGEAGNE
ncbi:MAG: PD-(D/E)XK nuclease family protein [Opitutae bacterium]|nr:PD-(D/E)XK nuclease family protein [Opitutae bacterium]